MRQALGQTLSSSPTDVGNSEGTQVLTTTGTDSKAHIILAATIGVVAILPVQWRFGAQRAWSFLVYYVGYRLLSLHVSCGSLAVSGVPLMMKCAA